MFGARTDWLRKYAAAFERCLSRQSLGWGLLVVGNHFLLHANEVPSTFGLSLSFLLALLLKGLNVV